MQERERSPEKSHSGLRVSFIMGVFICWEGGWFRETDTNGSEREKVSALGNLQADFMVKLRVPFVKEGIGLMGNINWLMALVLWSLRK